MTPPPVARLLFARPDGGGAGAAPDEPSGTEDGTTPDSKPAERNIPALGNAMPDRVDLPDLPRLPQLHLSHPPVLLTDDDRWSDLSSANSGEAADVFEAEDSGGRERGGSASSIAAPVISAPPRAFRAAVAAGAERLRGAPQGLVIGFAIVAVLATVFGWWRLSGPAGPSGTLTVTSRPAGATFLVDGEPRGTTPASVQVPAGSHVLEVRSAGPSQVVGVSMEEGGQVSRYFDLPAGTAPARLTINTTPAAALVTIDGRLRGRSPLVVEDLNPGAHRVRATLDTQSLERTVMMASGANGALNLTFNNPDAAPPTGYGLLAVSIPIDARGLEGASAVGTTREVPWQLRAGRHELEFVNQLLDVHVRKSVDISDGRIHGIEIEVAPGALSVTTPAGAEIFVDGQSRGTAVVEQPVTAGQHDVIARHPVLGERRLLVTVLPGAAIDIAIDFAR